MSDIFSSISQCLFLISLYCLIYKSVGAVGNFISAYRNQIKTKAAAIKNETDIKTTLDILSPKEIGIIKFILRQDLFIAWLPHDYLPVLLLEKKNILSNVDHTATKNIPLEHGASINQTCSLYTINENILRVITASSIEKSPKWKKAKVDNRFKPFQDD